MNGWMLRWKDYALWVDGIEMDEWMGELWD